jgi:hypothetical protein
MIMQKVLAHAQVSWYLEQGYDRVGGYVHPSADVTDLQTPVQLYQALGLLYADTPFAAQDEGVYVIRWPAYCEELYRIPFGGQVDADMRAWGEAGWCITSAGTDRSGSWPYTTRTGWPGCARPKRRTCRDPRRVCRALARRGLRGQSRRRW